MKKLFTLILVSVCLMVSAQHTIEVRHTYYTLEFDTVLKSPLISWYVQTTAHAKSETKIDRKSVAAFHPDPLIPAKYRVASDAAYRNNGSYDKGHLSPYSAFYFDLTAAKESMYYENTAPQISFFNEHPWEKLEQYVLKTLSPVNDSIYVYTGCLYGSKTMAGVPVPDYYWKYITYAGHSEAWLAKNEPTTTTDYAQYSVSSMALKTVIQQYYPYIKIPF